LVLATISSNPLLIPWLESANVDGILLQAEADDDPAAIATARKF